MNFEREEQIIHKGLPVEYRSKLEETGAFLAGGAVASVFSGTRINDYDIYFRSPEGFKACNTFFEEQAGTSCVLEFFTPNALTYKIIENGTKVQLITAFTGTAEEIFGKFDFTCCMGAYHFMNKEFKFHKDFLPHLSQRRLVFNTDTPYPLSSLVRVRKYIKKKGFTMDAVQLVKMALSIHNLELDDYATLKSQLQGVDILLFKQFLDKLEVRKNEPYEFEEFVKWLEEIYNDLEEEKT